MRPFQRRLAFQNLENRRLLAAVDVPDNLSAPAGQVILAPINIDTASGVRGVEIRLSYDTTLLDLTAAGVTAGSVWSGAPDTQVTANVDDAAGTVVIFVAASSPLSNISGSLVNLSFTIQGSAGEGATAILDLTQVTLNDGQIIVNPTPVPGPDPTDGLVTVSAASGTNRIGGFVYADTNVNSLPDPNEGIPGVVITIVNQATSVQRQTITGADGSYEFLDLPVGTYTVTEHQPLAYLEGGVNELTVTVAAGTTTEDQNFRELGLRPEFVYNRLLATPARPIGSPQWTDVLIRINVDANEMNTLSAPTLASASTSTFPPQALQSRSIIATPTANSEPLGESIDAVINPSSPIVTSSFQSERDIKESIAVDRVFAEGGLF